jgi:hypothetical protein
MRSTEPAAARATSFDATHAERVGRLVLLLSLLLTTITLAYFYVADNYFFSTRYMSRIFQYLLMLDDARTVWLTLAVCVLAVFWKRPAPVLQLVDFVSAHVIAVVLATTALLGLGALFIYHNNAFSMDEYAAVFQAKIFAAGRLTGQVPPSVVDWVLPQDFNGSFLVASRSTGQTMSGYWPGFSLILSLFESLRIPWLCNATLAGVSLVLIHRITFEITADRRAAGWAVLFAIACGAFVAYAISYYSMQAHLTANLLFAWLLMKPTSARAFLAGIVGSLALVLHNPFPHALFAIPWILAIIRSQEHRRFVALLFAGYLPLLLLLGAGWLHLRGVVTAGNSGFNVPAATLRGYFSFPDRAMMDAQVGSLAKLWVWAVPGLFPLALLGRLRCGADPRVRVLTQSAMLTLIGYVFFVFDQGHGWGYRYFHSAFGVVPILAACGIASHTRSSDRLLAFAGAVAVLNLVIVLPVQMGQIQHIIARHMAQLPPAVRPGNNVYFVRANTPAFYLADLVQMDPLLRQPDLILFSPGPDAAARMRRENWPNTTLVAVTLVARRFGVEEWHLGPIDQRRESADLPGVKHFVLHYSPDDVSTVPLPDEH